MDRAGNKRNLTGWFESTRGPAWSPDGREVWFAGARRGGRCEPRAVTLSGRVLVDHQDFRVRTFFRGEADVTDRELSFLDASWLTALSRDGSLVVFVESTVDAPSPFLTYLRAASGAGLLPDGHTVWRVGPRPRGFRHRLTGRCGVAVRRWR